MMIQNQSGASIWIGSTGVTVPGGAKPGIEIATTSPSLKTATEIC
jgi:hypothetical protein